MRAPTPPIAPPPRHLRIFLASPGDVADERALALKVLEDLQYDPLVRGQITVETVAWDKPGAGTPMRATLTPQQAIAQGLPKPSECDIVIVILWSRLGTPLPPEWTQPDGRPYRSGTEWEYEDARQAAEQHGQPKLLLYRRTEKVLLDPDDPEFDENSRQWRLVKDFFAALRNPDGSIRGSCNEYTTPLQFKDDLTTHLRALLLELAPELRSSSPGAGAVTPPRPDLRAATAHYLTYLQDRHQYLSLKGMGLSERVPLQLPLLDLYVPLQARLELPPGETWDRSTLRLAGRVLNEAEQEALTGRLSEPRPALDPYVPLKARFDLPSGETGDRSPVRLAGRDLTEAEQEALTGRLSEPQPVLDLLQQRNGLVILGDPGAGKTTFLKYLVLRLGVCRTFGKQSL